ncbi:F0F1 ATP synthase subunit B [Candidatus Nomurabacteria bacterium]|nr:F0F1 ATP synthase subunit B [Candidatus Nomurabacteria bacterium]
MDSLIQAFGIDVRLITIQVINFVILASLLSYFLYKPVLKLISERESKIKQGLQDAEDAKKTLEGAEGEKKEILSSAHLEAEAVEKRAESHAKEKAEAIAVSAAEASAAKLRQAESRAEALIEEARKKSEAEVAKIAVLAAEEILKKS